MPAFARLDMPVFQVAGVYCAYDASSYTGITFWAKGNVTLSFRVATVLTMPSDQGGYCTSFCYDHNSVTVSDLTSAWQQYTFTWSQLVQRGWDGSLDPVDPAGILELQWEVTGANAAGPWEFAVDEIAFAGG